MIVTALIMGFAGSMHCVGMCSPLAMAVSSMNANALLNKIIYNTGRIFTYGLLGAAVTTTGFITPLSKYQNLVSIILGIGLLLIAAGLLKPTIPFLSQAVGSFTVLLKSLFAKFIKKKNYGSILFLGVLNGFLPCGLVLIALTYALTLNSTLDGFTFMLLFGAGTLPVMLGLTGVLQYSIIRFNLNLKSITTGMLILSGALLIARVFITELPHHPSIEEGIIDIVLCK